ncbi:MAG: hypothetical protein DU429_06050 [Candidatus Tokpelaia sp.]|uniref:hypothetical protein n=1 Tax=Candidatus Tokpelaia sp. TaxID=2233777 RepID=UPI0012387DF2|nr:hypothetical protein [Candidatus Tokpelaia sp.]KAA6206490.1 MAG: hypothetical protein DU429_06050 [Candidatus Tokpelaia sp.]KAA6206557.1 MAG: hypothetical protein DU430_00210 [Candidatus Tokpelaia sp.]KAA6405854.1 hypothetical protein DPQ22_02480 [Candidatus Tokpelaia sp.]
MKKNRSGRLLGLFIMVLLAISGVFWLFGLPGGILDRAAKTNTGQAGGIGGLSGQGAASKLPELPPVFARMSAVRRQQVIAQAQQDAEAAARAGGQSGAQAAIAGQAAAAAAQRAFARSFSPGGKP